VRHDIAHATNKNRDQNKQPGGGRPETVIPGSVPQQGRVSCSVIFFGSSKCF
jgi:hypothetical protein